MTTIQKLPTAQETKELMDIALRPQRTLLTKANLPEVVHKPFAGLKTVIDLVRDAKRAVPQTRDKIMAEQDLTWDTKDRRAAEHEANVRGVLGTAIELCRKDIETSKAAIEVEVENGARLLDDIAPPRTDWNKLHGSDAELARLTRAAHSAGAATAKLLARQTVDRVIDSALQRAGSDVVQVAETLIITYRGVLAENDALITNAFESHGIARIRREVSEPARLLLESEVTAKRHDRLPDVTKRLVQFRGALADCATYLRAIEGDVASPDFFTLRGGKGTAAHLRDLLPELWEE